jgi:hypothetical protein
MVVHPGDNYMQAIMPYVRDGTSTSFAPVQTEMESRSTIIQIGGAYTSPPTSDGSVDDGKVISVFTAGAGELELLDSFGHRLAVVPPYTHTAFQATEVAGDWGLWREIPYTFPTERSTYNLLIYASAASDATPDVEHVETIEVQSTVAITYLDGGVVGQRVTLTLAGGTNTTQCIITNAASFALADGRNWNMSTGESLEMQMISTGIWAEVGRKTNSSYKTLTCSETSEVDADNYDFFNISCTASAIGSSGIPGGFVGQIITFYTSKTGPSMHHSSAANYLHMEDLNIVLSTQAVATDHGTSYICVANAWMMFQKDPASRWIPINDGGWPSSV